jgi:hypothetical protein
MTESERAEALVLRAQTHVAFGDLDAAEDDFAEILRMRPGYAPDPSLTPRKAMERFERVRADLVGALRVDSDPPDARLFLDGLAVVPDGNGLVRLLAGEYELRVERVGFDASVETIRVEAGKELTLSPRLVPNARSVILRTEPADVEVLLDGEPVGRTERPGGGLSSAAAELVIENVPLGEHRFQFRKECYRTAEARDTLTVDLLDRSPKRYDRITLSPSRATLVLDGGPAEAEVSVDGKPSGGLPAELEICPGERRLEIRLGQRVIWRSTERLVEATTTRVDVEARPNLALAGIEKPQAALADLIGGFNDAGAVETPSGFDPAADESWAGLRLPGHTDLVLTVVRATHSGGHDRWLLYSPILRTVAELVPGQERAGRPVWYGTAWGFTVVDSEIGGPARVATVDARGPAAEAGLAPADRIVSLGGREVSSASDVRSTLRAASSRAPIEVHWRTARGEAKQGTLTGRRTPLLEAAAGSAERAVVRAAWALVDSLSAPEGDPAALANLALLLGAHGQHEPAADTWRRVRWGDRPGIGPGTTSYYLGRELERLGREEQAADAYRSAAASEATTFDDDGPRVAPAARDRLIGLGVDVGD